MNKQKEEENEIDVEFLEAIEGIDGDEEILLPVQVVHQVVSSDEGTTLSIIQQEILNIRKKQLQGIELTFADTKKLETLGNIKTKIFKPALRILLYSPCCSIQQKGIHAIRLVFHSSNLVSMTTKLAKADYFDEGLSIG